MLKRESYLPEKPDQTTLNSLTRESDVIWRFDVGVTWTRMVDGKANVFFPS